MEEKEISMEVVNPHAAGIDVGSRSHWVAVGQREQDVREFGVFNQDLFEIADWFKEKQIRTIAMESTGIYWQNLYAVLISKGFHVILCNGKFTKNIKGKKTDIKDCQWIQKLHSLGLLSSSFLPDGETEQLRTYCRQRANLITLGGINIQKDAEKPQSFKPQVRCCGKRHLWVDRIEYHTCHLRGGNQSGKVSILAPWQL